MKNFIDKTIIALTTLKQQLSEQYFDIAVQMLNSCKGKVILIGIGKSGHIASKIAATMASTGTPAFFVHPREACHGDLGMISDNDMILAISHSGESSEILTILPILKKKNIKIITITSNPNSSMAKISDIHLCTYVSEEAGPLNLALTSSTTVTLLLGDAIAIALSELRNISKNDFAASHPGGSLGKKLLLLNEHIMHKGDEISLVTDEQSISEAIIEITQKKLGFVVVISALIKKLIGIFTDGDLRRILSNFIELNKIKIKMKMKMKMKMKEVTHSNCITVKETDKAADSLQIMQNNTINGLVVINEFNDVKGSFNIHDLIAKGIK